jgi:hypothetical protein
MLEVHGESMAVKEHIAKELEDLDEQQLAEVEDYLAYFRFRSRPQPRPAFDKDVIAGRYREFAAEDRGMAEERS